MKWNLVKFLGIDTIEKAEKVFQDFLKWTKETGEEKIVKPALPKGYEMLQHCIDTVWGKDIAVLGPQESGKSTLFDVLSDLDIDIDPTVYSKTDKREVEGCRVTFPLMVEEHEHIIPLQFRLKKSTDVGGEASFRESKWVPAMEKAHFLIYVADIEKILSSEEYQKRFYQDFEFIYQKRVRSKKPPRLIISFNKVDKLAVNGMTYNDQIEELQKKVAPFLENVSKMWGIHSRDLLPPVFLSLTNKTVRLKGLSDMFRVLGGSQVATYEKIYQYIDGKKAS